MDFSTKNKKTLKKLAEFLEIDVEAKKKNKPTTDELVVALETFEKEYPEEFEQAVIELDLDNEPDDDEEDEAEDSPIEPNIYTYVGKGESSPQRIKFMGLQEFVRGRPTKVTNPIVLAKIQGNPTFVAGNASQELLQDIEDEGMALAEKNRKVDAQMDANFKRKHGGGE